MAVSFTYSGSDTLQSGAIPFHTFERGKLLKRSHIPGLRVFVTLRDVMFLWQ